MVLLISPATRKKGLSSPWDPCFFIPGAVSYLAWQRGSDQCEALKLLLAALITVQMYGNRVIWGLYRKNGKEDGNYYMMIGLYWDNGNENGSYYRVLGPSHLNSPLEGTET